MTLLRPFVLCLLLTALLAFSVENSASAASTVADDRVMIRVNDNGVERNIQVRVPGSWTEYGSNEDCPDNHVTSQGRRFNHVHFHYDFSDTPIAGIEEETRQIWEVNTDNVRAYWNHYFGAHVVPSARVSTDFGETSQVNCFGYAFGRNTWIQPTITGCEIVYADDYGPWIKGPLDGPIASMDGYVVAIGNRHVAAVGWTCGAENGVPLMETSEKMKNSGIYCIFWDAIFYKTPLGSSPTGYYKKKP